MFVCLFTIQLYATKWFANAGHVSSGGLMGIPQTVSIQEAVPPQLMTAQILYPGRDAVLSSGVWRDTCTLHH